MNLPSVEMESKKVMSNVIVGLQKSVPMISVVNQEHVNSNKEINAMIPMMLVVLNANSRYIPSCNHLMLCRLKEPSVDLLLGSVIMKKFVMEHQGIVHLTLSRQMG